MKKIVFNGFFVVQLIISAIAIMRDQELVAIWLALMLILIKIDEIHDTLKAKEPK